MDGGPSQQRAFDLVKDELSKTPVLALYDQNRETTVSADASSYGLGAVLRQRTNGTLRPVAYASRAMTPTEKRYSQIEKGALATTWSLERFNDYLNGMSFQVEADHKPLVSLLSSKKNLDELSPRIQRFRMRLMRYMHTIAHVPGKSLVTADALSRAPQERPLTEAEELLTDEVTAQANLFVGARRQDRGYSGRQGRYASFVSCIDPDDMSTKESTTSGADAERNTRTDGNR